MFNHAYGNQWDSLNNMIKPELDGVDHINIYSKGKTKLGRLLSNFARVPVDLEEGVFQSLEGYWYYLLSNKDQEAEKLKALYGYKAKEFGRELELPDYPANLDEEFQEKFKKAMKAKIEQNSDIKTLLKESTLPFKHYYTYGNKVVEPKDGKWMLDYWEELRTFQNLP